MSIFVTNFLRIDYGENRREQEWGKEIRTDGILLKMSRNMYII